MDMVAAIMKIIGIANVAVSHFVFLSQSRIVVLAEPTG
jgi:hypothetical protein